MLRLRKHIVSAGMLLLAALITLSLVVPSSLQAQAAEWELVSELDPTFTVEWIQAVYDANMREATNPPNAARIYGYAGVTIYESLFPGMPFNRSFVGQLNGLRDLPYPDESLMYDWQVVTAAAMQTVLSKLFQGSSQETLDSFTDLMEAHTEQRREAGVDEAIIENSLSFGAEFGQGVLQWISADNYEDTRARSAEFEIPTGEPYMWIPTTEGAPVVEPLWGEIRPFALSFAGECSVELNYEFSTEEDSAFYQQAVEVMELTDNSTDDQRATVDWWIDTPGLTGAPAGHWMLIASQMVDHLGLDAIRTAEMYALVGISTADAFISCWESKYRYNLIRPVTYIQEYINRRWNPIVETPSFPEYPSGHSVVSGAAADTLTALFGQVVFTDTSNTFRGFPERTFYSFEDAANEAAISRIYGGIHYRAAVENGVRQGRCVSARIMESIILNPIRQGE